MRELRQIQPFKQYELSHYKMEERNRKCNGVSDKFLHRHCALLAKGHSLSGLDLLDKVRSVLGLYEKREDDKQPKT